jgi:hypothetical protein
MVDTIRTQADLLTNLFQNGQTDGSITANDIRDLIVSIDSIQGHQWDFHLDSLYTIGAKRAIAAGVRTKITCDGLLDEQSSHPTQFWDTGSNRLTPNTVGEWGLVRLAMTGWSDAANSNHFEMELDVGGAASVIFQETGVFAKGSGFAQSFNFSIPLFSGADFVANGGEFFITPLADASFWQFAVTTYRGYAIPV